jgi:hypothetical protein
MGKRTMGRRAALLLAGLALGGALAAGGLGAEGVGERVPASGKEATRELDNRGFDRVAVGYNFEAELAREDEFRVTIRVDEAFLPYLLVRQSGGTLSIGFRPGFQAGPSARRPLARLALPELRGLEASGASAVTVQGFRSSRPLEVTLSGGSSLAGEIEAGDVRVSLSGASRLQLDGSGRGMSLEASGASEVVLDGFPVEDLRVSLSGASRARVNAGGRLDVEAGGASQLSVRGGPTMGRVDLSGASSMSSQ